MRIIDFEQGSKEWLQSRLGCPSGSNFDKLITSTGKPSTQSQGYINQLIAEILTNKTTEVRVNEAMQRGTDLEPEAREFYELAAGVEVLQTGFIKHSNLEAGVSPDGLVGDDGGLEIKCPSPSWHCAYLRSGDLPAKYVAQVQGCLWITNRSWWDFMSYHEEMRSMIVRVWRDEDFIRNLAIEVGGAVATIQSEVNRIRKM
tara:strand:- start:1536 stop:2138 length:603 start_codon:yes stop_codon:yes gene_type:complete